jgi:hypothetical protein
MAKRLHELSLPEDFPLLLRMPVPEKTYLGTADNDLLLSTARAALALWRGMTSGEIRVPTDEIEAACPFCGESISISGDAVFDRAIFTVGTTYDFSAKKIAKTKNKVSELIPGLNLSSVRKFTDVNAAEYNTHQVAAQCMTMAYFHGWIASYFFDIFEPFQLPAAPVAAFETIAHDVIGELLQYRNQARGYAARLVDYLLTSTVKFLTDVYRRKGNLVNKEHHVGPFSQIRTSEIGLLARRDKNLTTRYGDKQIEKVFEYQLNLILQSLGFYVVLTRSGQRTVDLVCISRDPNSGYSFLVEAKSTTGPYSLPSSDERALADYVNDFRKNLTSLQKLSFVIVVGPSHSKTLERKLIALESKVGIPVRFWSAQDLANLREEIVGPVLPQSFLNAVLCSPRIMPPNSSKHIADEYNKVQKAHQAFVASLLPSAAPTGLPCEGHEVPSSNADS